MKLLGQSLAVVGAGFPNKAKGPTRRFEIAVCTPGDPIELRPEPKNPADERAIAVYSERGVQLGYLRAEHAYRMGKYLQAGHTIIAVFQEATSYGAAIRVAFDGKLPLLPETTADETRSPHQEQDFWPDEIWPDE
ncbi:HIRAN domain-containing protein [Novosphingobium sp. AP12]|uniref:HIRAN domain-containing protein n=1 Tax=Novosphingobium sp. AP12 TaxID=1144305 RepID=UPI0006913C3B|nr:HIRAN domain-containing protein [Novosphingobium sp. AP12]